MLAQGRGSIVDIGSLASSTALGRGNIAYSMAMGAVIQMTRELSTEWSYRAVRVNCVTPVQVINPGLSALMAQDPTLEARFLKGIPAGRLGKPTDIMASSTACFGRIGVDHQCNHTDGRRQYGNERWRHART